MPARGVLSESAPGESPGRFRHLRRCRFAPSLPRLQPGEAFPQSKHLSLCRHHALGVQLRTFPLSQSPLLGGGGCGEGGI